jgi:hypothetical protein
MGEGAFCRNRLKVTLRFGRRRLKPGGYAKKPESPLKGLEESLLVDFF